MCLYDKIIASGLYIFYDSSNPLEKYDVIKFFQLSGLKLNCRDLKLDVLKDYVIFQDDKFFLKDNLFLDEIEHLIDPYFALIFKYIKLSNQKHDTNTEKIIKPKSIN